MRYFFRVEYDGTRYSGWQTQPRDPSVQSTINHAFSVVTRQPCTVVGGGRTDAGVHARGQGGHVDIAAALDCRIVEKSVNAVLPGDVAIYHLQPVADDFHARFSAVQRRYSYYIITRKMPLQVRRAWSIHYAVDWERVAREVTVLTGEHDFTTFCASGHNAKSMRCRVDQAHLLQRPDGFVFTIAADRFLYKMVRSIVGTLMEIGRGGIARTMAQILDDRDRQAAGSTAPAWGLVLEYIRYREVDDEQNAG